MVKAAERKGLSEILKTKAAAVTAKQKGILLMVMSAFLFSAVQVFVRMTGDAVPLMEQVFFRNFIGVIISYVIARRGGFSMFGERKDQPLLFMRSGFGMLGIVSYFYASSHAAQADVAILIKLSAFLITLFAFLFLKERIARIQVPALFMAFGGAFIVANPSFHSDIFPLFILSKFIYWCGIIILIEPLLDNSRRSNRLV